MLNNAWIYIAVMAGVTYLIRVLPLTTAFANKAVTTAWGLLWGLLFFHEQITIGKIVGVALVIGGVVLFSTADAEAVND